MEGEESSLQGVLEASLCAHMAERKKYLQGDAEELDM
jgi:hypothetical protein